MPKLSIKELLKISYRRTNESLLYFQRQAVKCPDPINKAFLLFLTGKKREELVILEKIALNKNINIDKYINNKRDKSRLLINQSDLLYVKSLKEIYAFSYKYAVNELDFYMKIDSFITDEKAKYAYRALVQFTQDFIFDVRSEYINFLSKIREKQHDKKLPASGYIPRRKVRLRKRFKLSNTITNIPAISY